MVKSPMAAIRLVIASESDSQKAGRFTAWLESTREFIVDSTRQPLVDGARVLLARGFDPATPLTMRHEGSAHDSFRPTPLGEWAKWTYEEGERTALQRRPWRPFAAGTGHQKSGSESSVAPEGRETEIRFHGGPPQQLCTLLGAA
jgi:hypothetical protein